jgi:exosortase/archaeosortase family protein
MKAPPNRTTLRFAIRFMVIFAALMGAFEAARGTAFERVLVEDILLGPATATIQLLSPDGRAGIHRVGRTLRSPTSELHVTRGCEGVEILLMIAAAILAYPASVTERARGLAGGLLLTYGLSVARLVALHFTLRYAPGSWEALHGVVLALIPILIGALFFLRWSSQVALHAGRLSEAKS